MAKQFIQKVLASFTCMPYEMATNLYKQHHGNMVSKIHYPTHSFKLYVCTLSVNKIKRLMLHWLLSSSSLAITVVAGFAVELTCNGSALTKGCNLYTLHVHVGLPLNVDVKT